MGRPPARTCWTLLFTLCFIACQSRQKDITHLSRELLRGSQQDCICRTSLSDKCYAKETMMTTYAALAHFHGDVLRQWHVSQIQLGKIFYYHYSPLSHFLSYLKIHKRHLKYAFCFISDYYISCFLKSKKMNGLSVLGQIP